MWGESQDSYNQMYDNQGNQQQFDNQPSFGHEVVAGGAAFAGFKMFEDRQRAEGKPVSHQFAKEMLAGLAGAEVDRFAESSGENWFDKEKAKRQARQQAQDMYQDHYGGQDQYDPNQYGPPQHMQQQFGDNWGGNQGGNQGGYDGGNQGRW